MTDKEMNLRFRLTEMRDEGFTWNEIRKHIDSMEENENEAASERFYTEPGAWDGGFAKNH